MASKYVDLRCERRITLAEANLIAGLLADNSGAVAERAIAKFRAAIKLAGHQHAYGPDKRCVVCGEAKGFKRYAPTPRPRLRLTGDATP